MSAPTPRHARPARRFRRAVPRHAASGSSLRVRSNSNRRSRRQAVSSLASVAVTVAGATVMSGGAYGVGPIATLPPPVEPGTQRTADVDVDARPDRLGSSDTGSVQPAPLPAAGPTSSLEQERLGRPASIWINSISTGSDLIELGLNATGSLETPVDFGIAGWWKGGPRPGDPGPAVITGHLDSKLGPGVFAKLGRVKPGDQITVRRNDGRKLLFSVTRIDRYPKRAFPTRTVYGPTDASELRVITCGGSFDPSVSSYEDNIVVFATLVDDGREAAGPPAPDKTA